MNHKEQQIKNSFLYFAPFIVRNILPLITVPVFTRILTPKDYGILALAMVYAIFINGLANFGMSTAYDRNFFKYRGDHKEASQLLFSILSFVMFNFLLLAGLTYPLKRMLSNLIIGSPDYGDILFWSLCAQFLVGVNIYYLAYFKNSENAKVFIVYTIALGLLNFFLSLFLVAYLRIGVIGLVYSQLYSGLVIFGMLSYRFIKTHNFSINKKILYDSLKISYPLTPKIFIGAINSQFDKYMIGLLATVGGVGIYSIGQKISNLTWTFMTALQNVFSPQIYKRMFDLKQNEGAQNIGGYLTPFIYICMFFAFIVSLFSEELISILMPPSYHGAIDIVAILCMYYGIAFFRKITGPQIIFKRKTYIILIESIIGVTLNIGLNILLIKQYGATGAAIATFLTGLITVPIFLSVAQHFYRINWKYGNLFYIYSCFLGFTIVIIILRKIGITYQMLLMIKIIALAIYTMIGVKLDVVTKDNYLLIKGMLSKFKLRFQQN